MATPVFSYGPELDREDSEEAYRYARLTPGERLALDARTAQTGAVKGAEAAIRGATGLPEAPENTRARAADEIRALAQKSVPGTPEFYRAAADVFRKYGLVSEAETMMQRLTDVEFGKGEQQEVMKLQRVRDQLQKRLAAGDESVKPALAAIDRKLASYGAPAAGSQPADPEFIKLLNAYDAAVAAGQTERAESIKKAMDAWLKQKAGTGADMTPYQAARLALDQKKFDEQTRKTKETEDAARAQAVSALQGMVRALDIDLQNSKRLLVHPGLGWITGPRAGVAGRAGAALSGDAAGAHGLFLNVQAQTFIRALQDLKATSKTGASGLGQLTEREGDKIQNAKVALDPQQPTEQFKRTLTGYIEQLETAREAGVSELGTAKASVPPAPPPISDRPAVRDVAPDAQPRPGPAPKPRKLTATRID